MDRKTSPRNAARPRRRGWRIPHTMPKDPTEAARLGETLGPRAYYRHLAEWPAESDEEMERLRREFREPTAGEIRAFRLRHGIPPDWTVTAAPGSWVAESPRWERVRPTPYSKYVRVVRVFHHTQEYFDEFHSECMEVGTGRR